MHMPFVLFLIFIVVGFSTPAYGQLQGKSVQEYMDTFIDEEKFRQHGISSLDEETRDHIWSYFKSFHGRTYSSDEEEQKRRSIFHDNINFVVQHKLKTSRTFEIGLNHLADLTAEEFKKSKKGFIPQKNPKRRIEDDSDEEDIEALLRRLIKLDQHHHKRHWKRDIIKKRQVSKNSNGKHSSSYWLEMLLNTKRKHSSRSPSSSFDWRSKNVVGSIKDQLDCGACYAFAASAVLESLYAIKHSANSVADLSPQQIVDCAGDGCDGGNFQTAINYIAQHDGQQATIASYPYVGEPQSCTTNGLSYSQLGNIEYTGIPGGDEKGLAADLVSYGPIFVGVDSSSQYFQFYSSGILNTTDCSNLIGNLDHAVAVVGYGYNTTLKQSYWIVKNSWGTSWGENGYILLAKDAGNMCGVATYASYAQLT